MASNKNVVAFAGCECFDIILYLSRLLVKTGRKVLVTDHSETKALAAAAPQIKGLNIKDNIVAYRDVDYTTRTLDAETLLPYDDVFLNCGMCRPDINLQVINRVVYVTDLFHFNRKRLAALTHFDEITTDNSLIIRDVINAKLSAQAITTALNKNIFSERVTVLYRDEGDYENSLLLNSGQTVGFRKISSPLRDLLLQEARLLNPEIQEKELKAAYKLAKKGA